MFNYTPYNGWDSLAYYTYFVVAKSSGGDYTVPVGVKMGYYENECFISTTKILLANGISKDIQNIQVGDQVVSYDMDNNQKVVSKVKKLQEHLDGGYEYYIINHTLEVTPNHPVLINGVWSPISNLEIGDILEDNNGNSVIVESIETGFTTNAVYNIIVKGYNNFYADNYLVASSF